MGWKSGFIHNGHQYALSVDDSDGGIDLQVDGYYVITITKAGTFFRSGGVGDECGLQLDDDGYIKEEGN